MKYMQTARELDRLARTVEAAWAYELAMRQGEGTLEDHLNLVAIYFLLQDLGFLAAEGISKPTADAACWRMLEVLDTIEQTHGPSGEVRAWRLYARERVAGEEIADAEYRAIVESDEAGLAKLRLYLSSNGSEFREDIDLLRTRVDSCESARSRYITSVLTSCAIGRSESVS